MISETARSRAESTLTATATVTRRSRDDFQAGQGVVAGSGSPVYSGPCSISPPGSTDQTTAGAGDASLETRTMRVPARATAPGVTGDPLAIKVADEVEIDGHAFLVHRIDDRTTEVLRRIRLVDRVPMPGVPR